MINTRQSNHILMDAISQFCQRSDALYDRWNMSRASVVDDLLSKVRYGSVLVRAHAYL